jgi:periplasmic copper chaperone A
MLNLGGRPRRPRGTLLAIAAAGAAFVLPATSALAHVTVNPRETPGGGYAKLAFRVPNERDNAGTTRLEINFPPDHPFSSVTVRPQPGWTYTVEKRTLDTPIDNHGTQISEVVSKVTWSGGLIKPGEFNEFEVSVGRLPSDVDSIAFKALQTYENGEIERPAPVLKLTKSSADAAGGGTTVTTGGSESQAGEVAAPDTEEAASKSDVDTARTFGLLGMAFGLIGFVAALAARRRRNPAE